jgi:hypothetical protein
MVAPEVTRMEESGAFVEHDGNTGFPTPEGGPIAHAETDGSGKFRMYFFYPEDYPEMHHHKQVCDEQTWLTFVNLYRLVSGESP